MVCVSFCNNEKTVVLTQFHTFNKQFTTETDATFIFCLQHDAAGLFIHFLFERTTITLGKIMWSIFFSSSSFCSNYFYQIQTIFFVFFSPFQFVFFSTKNTQLSFMFRECSHSTIESKKFYRGRESMRGERENKLKLRMNDEK